PKTSIICSPMTSLKTSIKTITYLSDTGCLEIQGASLRTIIYAQHDRITAICREPAASEPEKVLKNRVEDIARPLPAPPQ
ncbi:hypothetical protein, partial [Escherichia coli]